MSTDLTKKAVEMLLQGAVLLGQPCPYCSGVRVMKEGYALCISCGRKPQKKKVIQESEGITSPNLKAVLEDKISSLTKELEKEQDHVKQQEILKSINSVLEALEKLGKKIR